MEIYLEEKEEMKGRLGIFVIVALIMSALLILVNPAFIVLLLFVYLTSIKLVIVKDKRKKGHAKE